MNIIATVQRLNANRTYKIFYDIIMSFLAILIVFSLILQNREDLNSEQVLILNRLDLLIWLIFVSDYIIRFVFSDNKMRFVRTNIIDLISILPLDVAFQGLRAVRLARVFYMLRVFIYLNRGYKRLGAILTTNDFHHVIWFTFSTIFCGAIAISFVDNMDIGDALWWSFVTTTTVGYGDIAPTSLGGRIIAVFLMIVGIGFLSTLTGTIATYFIGNQKNLSYRDETLQQISSKLEDFNNLTAKDIDDIYAILIALKKGQSTPSIKSKTTKE